MAISRYRQEQTELERQKRRSRVEQMLLRGITNRADIAASFNVDYQTIVEDIRAIKEEWLQSNPERAQENCNLRVRQIEAIAILAINAFERSRQDQEEFTTVEKACDNVGCNNGIIKDDLSKKIKECPKCLGTSKIVVETRKVSGKAGDSSFLNVAKTCFVECARLEGLFPQSTSVLKRTIETEMTPEGNILQKAEEIFYEAPFELIIKAKAALEELRMNAIEELRDSKPSGAQDGSS